MLRIISCLAAVALSTAASSAQPQPASRVNVLFLMADDLNNDLGV